MKIKELKELIKDLPDDAMVYQETGDHELYEPLIDTSSTIVDSAYGLVEYHGVIYEKQAKPALIIR